MYRMISFFIAFSILCFGSGDALTIFMMSFTCFACFILLLWCVSAAYEDKPFWKPWLLRKLVTNYSEGIQAGEGRLVPSRPCHASDSIMTDKESLKPHNL